MPHRLHRLSDDGYRVYGALALLTSDQRVVKFLDESKEGKDLLESLYELRDSKELFEHFQVPR